MDNTPLDRELNEQLVKFSQSAKDMLSELEYQNSSLSLNIHHPSLFYKFIFSVKTGCMTIKTGWIKVMKTLPFIVEILLVSQGIDRSMDDYLIQLYNSII